MSNQQGSDKYKEVKYRLLDILRNRMVGVLHRDSTENLRIFDELFRELIAKESIILTAAERKKLRDELVDLF